MWLSPVVGFFLENGIVARSLVEADLEVNGEIFSWFKVELFDSINVIYGCSLVGIYSISNFTHSFFRIESSVWKALSIYSKNYPLQGHVISLSQCVEFEYSRRNFERNETSMRSLTRIIISSGQ